MYLKDILEGEVEKWMQPGSQIFIEAPTGCGKTTFILSEIREKAKEIGKPVLYLCNRVALKEQVKEIINRKFVKIDAYWLEGVDCLDWFCVSTYQAVAKKFLSSEEGRKNICNDYSFVVCDEFHFIVDDIAFNAEVIYACEYLRWQMKKTRPPRFLYLSATMVDAVEVFLRYLGSYPKESEETLERIGYQGWCAGKIFVYKILPKKRPYDLYFFDELKDIADLISDSEREEKWLIFVSNVNEFEVKLVPELVKNRIEYIFLDAELLKSDIPVVKEIREKERFEEKVLVVTKALDVGVNIKDESLRNVVLMSYDETNFMQMLGRKRLDGNKKIRVFVKNRGGKFFRKLEILNQEAILTYKLSVQELWKKAVVEETASMKLFLYMGADGCLYKNPLYIARQEHLRDFYESLFEEAKEFKSVEEAFRQCVMHWLGVDEYGMIPKDYKHKQQAICKLRSQILKEYSGILENAMQKKLGFLIKRTMEQEGMKDSTYKKNRQMGLRQINNFFEQWNVGIVVMPVRKQVEGVRTTFWEVIENSSNNVNNTFSLRDIYSSVDVEWEDY